MISTPPLFSAPDLSRYRDFQLGMSLITVARQAGITPEGRVLHQRPELIQELMWLPPLAMSSASEGDSVRKVLFSFYNDQLFRMVVTYDREKTGGLTTEDMVKAISSKYGPSSASSPETMISLNPAFRPTDKIVARWEDSQHSITLFRSTHLSTFGLVVLSKRLDGLVKVATDDAMLLDEQQAPQREIERQQELIAENRIKQETARRVNKVTFRP